MKCVICKHGETKEGTTTVTFDRDGMTLVVKDVPAQVCTNCGEDYVDETCCPRNSHHRGTHGKERGTGRCTKVRSRLCYALLKSRTDI